MHIENISRVGFASRWTTEDERDLPIRPRMFGEIIIDHEHILPLIHEIFTDGTSGIRREVRECRRIRCSRDDDRRKCHRPRLLQFRDDSCDLGFLLSDSDIDTSDVLSFLIDDCIDSDGGLPRLTITDDEFALSTTDRNESVDRLDTGLNRLVHGLSRGDARGDFLHRIMFHCRDRTLTIDRKSERIHYAPHHLVRDRYRENSFRSFHDISFFQCTRLREEHHTDFIFFEVQYHTDNRLASRRHAFHHFLREDIRQSRNACHTIAHFEHGSYFLARYFVFETGNLLLQFFNEWISHIFHSHNIITYNIQHGTWNMEQIFFSDCSVLYATCSISVSLI